VKTIYIRGGKANNTAINVMKHHLEALGHPVTRSKEDPFQVGLSWGVSYEGEKPFLNSHVNRFNKFTAFTKFRDAGAACPVTYPIAYIQNHVIPRGEVWLARRKQHTKGKDIVACKDTETARQVAMRGEHDFFSVFIPVATEYRVWVLHDKAFATYEKVFKGEGEYEGFARNRRFGFSFQKRDNLVGSHQLEGPCIAAVKSLGMDWGAVDILKGKDGKYYVLEVNSMPHISNIQRSCGVRLAKQVSMWAERL